MLNVIANDKTKHISCDCLSIRFTFTRPKSCYTSGVMFTSIVFAILLLATSTGKFLLKLLKERITVQNKFIY